VIYAHPGSVMLIFCKAPVPGQVKTRLLPALSAVQAAGLHKRLTRITIERALRQRLCPVQLWCTPDTLHPFFRQCAQDYPLTLHRQNGSDLGERMHNAFDDALQNYRSAILTGCDCPSLQAADLKQALIVLESCDAVFAPAEDGGYVLVGLNRPQAALFENIPWGSENVMELTRNQAVLQSLSFNELPQQWDVDTSDDLTRLYTLESGNVKAVLHRVD
jgi:rSAM/selenodomain-associated transferase 1